MIKKILTHYAARLDEYLSSLHHRPEGMAEVGFMGRSDEIKFNKIVLSLVSMERETTGGISASVRAVGEGYVRMSPPLLLNLNVVLAAVYDERQYAESLSVLSDTLTFIQSAPMFEVDGMSFTIEIVTLSTQDLNNVWTLLGGQYYPSVVCKIRRIVIDAEEITASGSLSKQTSVALS
ncbi:MAG: Pvc16 family protein [Bacteroides sp.]